jgi:hypothetical protein
MTGIVKTVQKIIPKELDPLRKYGNKLTGINQPKKVPPKAPVIPMPDEQALAAQAKKRPPRSGRASTVLSDDDRLGP